MLAGLFAQNRARRRNPPDVGGECAEYMMGWSRKCMREISAKPVFSPAFPHAFGGPKP
jgi:hypothetical protein